MDADALKAHAGLAQHRVVETDGYGGQQHGQRVGQDVSVTEKALAPIRRALLI